MIPQLIEQLNNFNPQTNKKPAIKPTNEDFILQLLKNLNLEINETINLLKDLDIINKDLKLPKNEQYLSEILKNLSFNNNLNKEIKKDKDLNTQQNIRLNQNLNLINNIDLKNDFDKLINFIQNQNDNEKLQNVIYSDLPPIDPNCLPNINETELAHSKKTKDLVENIADLLLNKKNNSFEIESNNFPQIKKEIDKIKGKITNSIKIELTKKIIDTNIKNKKDLSTQKIITQIKNSNSFEKLVSIANKNGLNIKQIIIKIIKKNIEPQKFENLPKTKISSIPLTKIRLDKTIKNSAQTLNQKNTKTKNILKTLLSNNQTDNNKNSTNQNINKIDNSDKKETKIAINPHNQNIDIKHKIIEAKETIKNFSNNLKDAIENYKPPINKLSIQLHPKELGKVDITIVHRGNNLQININSNSQAINFFHTNQTELKNALVNMGYSGIDMNFNSNQNKENQEKKAYKQYSFNKSDENYDELIIKIPYTYA